LVKSKLNDDDDDNEKTHVDEYAIFRAAGNKLPMRIQNVCSVWEKTVSILKQLPDFMVPEYSSPRGDSLR
jgi:hypothetical protein